MPIYKNVPVDVQTYADLTTVAKAYERKLGSQVRVMVNDELSKLALHPAFANSPISRLLRHKLFEISQDLPDEDIKLAIALLETRAEYYVKNPAARPQK